MSGRAVGAGLRLLYGGWIGENDTSLYRMRALRRLGHTALPLNVYDYMSGPRLLRSVAHRLQIGPEVSRFNRDVLAMAERERPDVFWADKLLYLRPQTVDKLRAMGILCVSYMIDNAFGPRRDPGWRLYLRSIPRFDLHVVQRDSNLEDYRRAGARDVIKVQTAFEPTEQFPPPPGWSDADRTRAVSFIGTPYDDRAAFFTRMWRDGVPISLNGSPVWRRSLAADALAAMYGGRELFGADYREAIWRSRINLSFITHSNRDEFTHKSFEIAGCGAFLLAERSAGHLERFREDEEAVFFSGYEECLAKIRRYLPDAAARQRIAAAGHARAVRDGYDNDTQMAHVIERVRLLLAGARSR